MKLDVAAVAADKRHDPVAVDAEAPFVNVAEGGVAYLGVYSPTAVIK
jgi:hypothetical protein